MDASAKPMEKLINLWCQLELVCTHEYGWLLIDDEYVCAGCGERWHDVDLSWED